MNLHVFMRKLFVSFGIWLVSSQLFMAFALLARIAASPAGVCAWSLIPASGLLISLAVRFFPSSFRKKSIVPGLLVCACCGFFLSRWLKLQSPAAVIPGALCTVLFCVNLRALSCQEGCEYPHPVWFIGLAAYLTVSIITRNADAKMLIPIKVFTFTYPFFLIIEFNKFSLSEGVGENQSPSQRMLFRNRIALCSAYFLALVIVNIKPIARFFSNMWKYAKMAILVAIDFLMNLFGSRSTSGGAMEPSPSGEMMALESGEPSLFMIVLEKVLCVLVIILLAAALCFLIRKAAKFLKKAVLAMIEKYHKYGKDVAEAYEDKVESIADWNEIRRGAFHRQKAQKRKKIPDDRLSPRERVRQDYWMWKEQEKVAPEKTAASALEEASVDAAASMIYDAARYSSHEISPEESRRFEKLVKSHK